MKWAVSTTFKFWHLMCDWVMDDLVYCLFDRGPSKYYGPGPLKVLIRPGVSAMNKLQVTFNNIAAHDQMVW